VKPVGRRAIGDESRGALPEFFSALRSLRGRGDRRRFNFSFLVFLLSAVSFALILAGCREKPLSKSQIHDVTQEIVAAAQGVVGRQSEITVRPEFKTGANDKSVFAEDHIYVSVGDAAQDTELEGALARVARKHDLTTSAASETDGVIEFRFVHDSQVTHTVHISKLAVAASGPAGPPKGAAGGPRLAIVIDDLGHDAGAARELFKLPYPLTISVIPNLAASVEVAEEAHRRGDEVLLHLPMEAVESGAKAETVELRSGMQSRQIDEMLGEMLGTVPHAAGVNNHQGSRATADAALMDSLMASLRRRGLFFVDSRTTVETIAYDTAERDGVRATFRSAQFLDDTPTRAAILKQLDRAVGDAERKGWAVTIGHPHPATIAALREALPRIQARGIQLVFVSDVVK
jgi:uncharacterized protein